MIANLFTLLAIGTVFIVFFYLVSWVKGENFKIPDFNKQQRERIRKEKRNNKFNQNSNEDKTLIGFKRKVKVFLLNKARHIFICGTTGAGKTVTISNFIDSVFKYDYPSLIVDGKGDTDKDSLLDIVLKFKEKYKSNRQVYIIDISKPSDGKYNPFKGKSPTIIKDMLINMSDWSEEHYKLNASRYIQKVTKLMEQNNISATFKNIIDCLDIEEFKKLSLNLVNDNRLTKKEHLENVKFAEDCKEIISGAIARFSLLLESDIGVIFDEEGISIPEALNEKAIIIFLLNPLTYPEMSPLLGRLITIDAKQGVSSLYHKKFKRTFLIFDEISEYASDALLLLVNQSRSANVTSILATQSLSDLDRHSEALRKQVIENCNNYIVMRQNEPTNAEAWANTFGTKESVDVTHAFDEETTTRKGSIRRTREFLYHPDIIKNLDTGEAIYMSKDERRHTKIKVNMPF